MSKNAAKEGVLGGLHGLIAQVLAAQVGNKVKVLVFTPDGEIELDEYDQPVTADVFDASPQLLATAIKFLKDNEITATAEQSVEVANLEDEVAKKRAANQVRKDVMRKRRDEANKRLESQ